MIEMGYVNIPPRRRIRFGRKSIDDRVMSVEVRDNHSEKTLHKDDGEVLLVSKARTANDVNPQRGN